MYSSSCMILSSLRLAALGTFARLGFSLMQSHHAPLRNLAANLQQAGSLHTRPVSNSLASVLVPLFEDEQGEVRVVLTQRSSRLPTHSDEVCLPGGKRDPGDADDVATALREAQEELGIAPSAVRIVGLLPSFLSKHLLSVTPVVGFIPQDLPFSPNSAEVASVFTAPLRMFLEGGPAYYSRDMEWGDGGLPYRLHYWRYSSGGQQYLIWGLTANILVSVAECAFGCKPAFEVSPPGAPPYTALRYDGTRVVWQGASPEVIAATAAAAALLRSPQQLQLKPLTTAGASSGYHAGGGRGEEVDGGEGLQQCAL